MNSELFNNESRRAKKGFAEEKKKLLSDWTVVNGAYQLCMINSIHCYV